MPVLELNITGKGLTFDGNKLTTNWADDSHIEKHDNGLYISSVNTVDLSAATESSVATPVTYTDAIKDQFEVGGFNFDDKPPSKLPEDDENNKYYVRTKVKLPSKIKVGAMYVKAFDVNGKSLLHRFIVYHKDDSSKYECSEDFYPNDRPWSIDDETVEYEVDIVLRRQTATVVLAPIDLGKITLEFVSTETRKVMKLTPRMDKWTIVEYNGTGTVKTNKDVCQYIYAFSRYPVIESSREGMSLKFDTQQEKTKQNLIDEINWLHNNGYPQRSQCSPKVGDLIMFKGVGVPLNIKELYGDLVNRTCEDGLRYPDSTCEALFIVREAEYSGENQLLPLLNIELQCIWSEDTFSVKPGHYLSESFMKMMEIGVVDTTQKETTVLKEDPLLTSVLTAGGFTIDDIGQSAQLIVVQSSGTSCAINLLEKNMQTGTWVAVYQTTGVVGKNGVSVNAQEGSMYTPRGAFPLDILAFGTHTQAEIDNINRFIKYQQITENSYWCDGVESPQYNQWVETANPDWSTKSEHLIEYQSSYEYAVFIGYNYNPVVAGKGSAFFLHVSSASYTAGCVGTSQASMQAIFSWLNFLKAPKILIF